MLCVQLQKEAKPETQKVIVVTYTNKTCLEPANDLLQDCPWLRPSSDWKEIYRRGRIRRSRFGFWYMFYHLY